MDDKLVNTLLNDCIKSNGLLVFVYWEFFGIFILKSDFNMVLMLIVIFTLVILPFIEELLKLFIQNLYKKG